MSEPDDATYSLGLVCEGPQDSRTVRRIVKRVVTDEVEWLLDNFDHLVGWQGVLDRQHYTRWAGDEGIAGLAQERDIRVHGAFSGEPGRGEALQAKKAIRLFRDAAMREDEAEFTAVLLIRDTDDVEDRREGMEMARDDASPDFEIVLGLPHTKRECWILVAYDPEGEDERERLDEERANLGFDPTEEAHRLTAQSDGALNDAKRVVDELLVDRDEDALIEESVVTELEDAGEEVGLSEFIREIRERLVPVL